jgi:hypothetical protein
MTFAFHDSVDAMIGLGEWQMGRRRIGQEHFRFGPERGESRSSSLTELAGLIDWAPIEKALADIHSAAKGEPAWPPLALFKAMLIAAWYDLSDVKLAEALDDRFLIPAVLRFCLAGANAGAERLCSVAQGTGDPRPRQGPV